jgi:hypothetical protein
MKSLTIDGHTFKYELCCDTTEYGDYYWTEFYQGEETVTRKKFWLFGEKITKTQPKLVFKLDIDIENPYYTKSDIREMLNRKIELMGRKSEIERGEIV